MTESRKCSELIPDGPGRFYWCDLPADQRSSDRHPRCAEHLTPDTTRTENAR